MQEQPDAFNYPPPPPLQQVYGTPPQSYPLPQQAYVTPPQNYPLPQQAYPSQQYSPAPQPYSPQQAAFSPPMAGAYSAPVQTPTKPTGAIAFTRGLFFGFLLILIVAAWITAVSIPSPLRDALYNAASFDPFGISQFFVSMLISLVQGIFAWIIFYFAGRAGARAGGKVSTGMVTCLWASLWYLLADLVGFVIIAVIDAGGLHNLGAALSSLPDFQQPFSIDAVLALIGLAFGAVGASRGARRLRQR